MGGRIINQRYKLISILEKGGAGVVWEAEDMQTGATVAVKQISQEALASGVALKRFEREVEVLQALNHPNIMPMLDYCVDEDNHYLIMPRMLGSILDLIELKGALPVEWVRHIGLDICDALTRAHRLGVVHRDIKPENILFDAYGTPVLTDFGLALLLDGTRLTGRDTILGSVGYNSPEVFLGKTADARSDIWSLGVVFYEMLAGVSPFNYEGIAEMMQAIVNAPPPPLWKYSPNVPIEFVTLIDKMLVKDANARMGSARQVAAALEMVPDVTDDPQPWPPVGTDRLS